MGLLGRVIAGTTCVTIFAGSMYVAAATLAPPPNYVVSNNERMKSYNDLAINNLYEKKTKSQEFYLGLSRWRRKILREEGVLVGRVLEVGAGCGSNIPYYPHEYLTDSKTLQRFLSDILTPNQPPCGSSDPSASSNNHSSDSQRKSSAQGTDSVNRDVTLSTTNTSSYMLQLIQKYHMCDEIVLCDRSPNMVESCAHKIKTQLGYEPYRYPTYSVQRISAAIRARLSLPSSKAHNTSSGAAAMPSVVRKKKFVHKDGSVDEVLTNSCSENEEVDFLSCVDCQSNGASQPEDGAGGQVLVPILRDLRPGDHLPLLSPEGMVELQRRATYMEQRQQFRLSLLRFLKQSETDVLTQRQETTSSLGMVSGGASSVVDAMLRTGSQERCAGGDHASTATGSMARPSTALSPPQLNAQAQEYFNSASQPLFSVANYAAEQLPFPDNSFDTVVDMFGLCSYDDPVRALRELSRVCKPDGKLLLIEHGKGRTLRINNHLDKWAPRHAKKWGCWWNRDISRIIRLSGVRVEKSNTKHFGTSQYIIARPFKTIAELDMDAQ